MYLYFQLPLMTSYHRAAIDGLKKEWREAAENLGANRGSTGATWRCPSSCRLILGTAILLFGNAFGAQATAYRLTGGTVHRGGRPGRPDQR